MNDLITVIVPVYNVEDYLNQCVKSILNQTYSNIELILVDDGSKDKSGFICDELKKLDNRVKVIHKENGGISSARNEGLKNANGKWISFVDSDDWIENDYLEKLADAAYTYNSDCVLCGYKRVDGKIIELFNASEEIDEYNSSEYLKKVLNTQSGFAFAHMKLIDKETIGQTVFNENAKVGEDAIFNIQISKRIKKVVMLNKPLYNYRVNLNSMVRKFDDDYPMRYLESMQIIEKLLSNDYANNIEIQQQYYNLVAFHVMLIAVNYCYNPSNPKKNKIKLLKEICNYECFKNGIKNSNYYGISLTRKITLFTLKHKLYWITALICVYRQKQRRGRNK